MIIHELRMNGFGKWRDRSFQFAPGLNLFAAPNESGKTTLLHALIASLYGMKKDYVRVTRYLEEYEKYIPWDKGTYETIVRYTLGKQMYRLHRHLEKERELARLFREPELLDVTLTYQEDRRKEFNFIERHLGLNRTLFTDVTWVKREPISAAEHLVPQLLKQQGGDPIAKQILLALDQELVSIGKKETAENTLLGKVSKQLLQSQLELEQAENAWESVKHLSAMVVRWQEELQLLHRQRERCTKDLSEISQQEQELQRLWQTTYDVKRAEQLAEWIEGAANASEQALHREVMLRLAELEERERVYAENLQVHDLTASAEESSGGITYLRFADIPEEEWQSWLKGWYTIAAYDQPKQAAHMEETTNVNVEKLQETYRDGWTLVKKLEKHRESQARLLPSMTRAEKAYAADEAWRMQRERKQEALFHLQREESSILQQYPNLAEYNELLASQAKQYFQHSSHANGMLAVSRQRSRTSQQQVARKTFTYAGGAGIILCAILAVVAFSQGWSVMGWISIFIAALAGAGTAVYWSKSRNRTLPSVEPSAELHSWLSLMNIQTQAELERLEQTYLRWLQVRSEMSNVTELSENPISTPEHLYKQSQVEWEQLQQEIDNCEERLQLLLDEWGADSWEAFLALRERHLAAIHRHEVKKQEAEEMRHVQLQLEKQMLQWGVPPHLPFAEAAAIVMAERAEWERRNKEDQKKLQDQLHQERMRAQIALEMEELAKEKQDLLSSWEEQTREHLQHRQSEMLQRKKNAAEQLSQYEQQIVELREQIARAQGEIGQRDQVSWAKAKTAHLESIKRLEEVLLRKDALQLARDTLQEVMEELSREISPDVNEAASQISSRMTGGRYQDVRLDPLKRFAVRVIEPTRQEVVDHEQLSTGTQDQLYFAQRIAFLRHLSAEKEALPLFLDDHFIHYDQTRLENALAFLLELAEEHQVFLFTCQNRELEYLEPLLAQNARHRIHTMG